MSIVLRPHHLLCTQGYSGHGYSEAFVEHMNDVVHQLREVPGTKIQLTFSTDTLCSCCPNKLGTDCATHRKGQAVRPQDRGVFRAGGKGIRLSGPHPGDRCQSHPRDAGRYLPGLLLVPHQRLLQEYLRRQIREITFPLIQQAAVQEMILHGGKIAGNTATYGGGVYFKDKASGSPAKTK